MDEKVQEPDDIVYYQIDMNSISDISGCHPYHTPNSEHILVGGDWNIWIIFIFSWEEYHLPN